MKKRILMIEDGRNLVVAVGDRLQALGYEFEAAYDGPSGLEKARAGGWDLLLVDLMLPVLGGDRIIRQLRSEGNGTPMVIVSARDQLPDKVAGLADGADDYIVKPFTWEELVARVEAHLRRGPAQTARETWHLDTRKPDLPFGEFTLCYRSGHLMRGSEPVALSPQEFRLLCLFADHPGEVLGTDRILREAWGYEAQVPSRTVYVHVAWLRRKLASSQRPDGHVSTVRGLGYVFEP